MDLPQFELIPWYSIYVWFFSVWDHFFILSFFKIMNDNFLVYKQIE